MAVETTPRAYEDFTLIVSNKKDNNQYSLKVVSSDGEYSTAFELSAPAPATPSGDKDKAAPESKPDRNFFSLSETPEEWSEEIGKALYKALFTTDGQVQRIFDGRKGIIKDRNNTQGKHGLRIKLQIDLAESDMANLSGKPWELLCDQGFLTLDEISPVVRYLEVSNSINSKKADGPIRILIVSANPTKDLNLEAELDKLKEIFQKEKSRVEFELLLNASKSELQDALKLDAFDVLHFMGHGTFDDVAKEGTLVLRNKAGEAEHLRASELEFYIKNKPRLKLVFLNACKSAVTGSDDDDESSSSGKSADPFGGIAARLVKFGVPAVVAMQKNVPDDMAIRLAELVYRDLSKGFPLEVALTNARVAIHLEDPKSMDWAIPVLFMRSKKGVLFPVENEEEREVSEDGGAEGDQVAAPKKPVADTPAVSPDQPKGTQHKDDRKKVFINFLEKDFDSIVPLYEHLTKQNLEVLLPKFDGKPEDILREKELNLATCDAIILVNGTDDYDWYTTAKQELEILHENADRPIKLMAHKIYLAPPNNTDKKIQSRLPNPAFINGLNGFEESIMADFIKEIDADE